MFGHLRIWSALALFASPLAAQEVDFARDVKPILASHCYACHGPDEVEGGLSFVSEETAFAELDSGEHAIVRGKPNESELLRRILSEDEDVRMPPEGDRISEEDADILRTWIKDGAQWKDHWGFSVPNVEDPPKVDDPEWNDHPIDAFIFSKLSAAGMTPNGMADRRTLIRRATYDLTGLPPTLQQVRDFLADQDPSAYERLIDRLLQSPQYGERWGRHWLDLVRYAETNSFERDGPKPNAWKYRDYVIDSLNQDKPYDQFLREQIAGDELENTTLETITATGFYRLGIWDDEPADRLLQRYDELDDIITTIGQGMLGLTLNCARCHDHKIDPITQVDYYKFVSLLSDLSPYDRGNNINYDVSEPETLAKIESLRKKAEQADRDRREVEKRGIVKMSAKDQRTTEGPQREKLLNAVLKDYLSQDDWKLRQRLKKDASDARKKLREIPRETILALVNNNPKPQPTTVMLRGNPHVPGDVVEPGFPSLFEPKEIEIPSPGADQKSAGRRLALANWIASPENRMSARVMANRVWQFHFGRGIVRSSNNFGQIGVPPTHPALLDWLGKQLVDGDWRLKPFHKLIMTSRAYRMSSAGQEAGLAKDPGNDLFWRFNMRRLSAEEIRDSLLAVNGSLNLKMGGPSFYEKLSQEVLAGQSRPGSGWGNSSPEERNRRSVYIHVKRSLLTPLLSAFDLPEPDRSCEARFATLQPGQALSLLNSEFVNEQSRRLADVSAKDSKDLETSIRNALARVLSRDANEHEIDQAKALIDKMKSYGQSDDEAYRLYCLSLLNWNEFVFLD